MLRFLLLILISLVLSITTEKLLNTDQLLLNSFGDQLTQDQFQDFLSIKNKWKWLGYVLLPAFFLLKISIIAAILDIGAFFFEKEVKYKVLFDSVVKAEFVFLGVIILKTGWFYFSKDDFTLEDLQYFYPLSALNVIGYHGLQPWYIYPLQILNLFEVAYWIILAYLLGKELQIPTGKGLSIVASSYGVGLLIWVVGVMFFTLNMS